MDQREYRVSNGRRLAPIILGCLFIAGGVILFVNGLIHARAPMIIFGVALMPFGMLIWIDAVKTKIVIDNKSIESTNVFGTRKFPVHEIVSYGITKGNYFLISEANTVINIPGGLEGIGEVKEWIEQRFKNNEKLIVALENRYILANETFGANEEERRDNLVRGKRNVRAINIILIAAIATLIAYPHYTLGWFLTLALPFAVLYNLWYFKGLITINADKNSAYPSLFVAMLVTCLTTCISGLVIYRLYEFNKIGLYLIGGTIILTLATYCILYTRPRNHTSKKGMLIPMIFLFAAYSLGAVTFINCNYDQARPIVYRLPVINKHIKKSSKSTDYFITVTAWGHSTGPNDMSVSKKNFEKIRSADTVSIYLYKGYLDIPWYIFKP